MAITSISPQLRTTDMASTIEFYTVKLGFELEFRYEDFYAGIRAGSQTIHLKYACDKDPSIEFVNDHGHLHLYFETSGVTAFADHLKVSGVKLEKDVHETPWRTREFVIRDDQGHTLYFGEPM